MRQQFFKITIVLAIAVLCFCVGCDKGPQKPKDMPDLFPCVITITQGNVPLEGALVVLTPKSGVSNGWSTDGVTNAKGVVELKTHGDFKGVPPGEFLVLVTKTELSPSDLGDIAPTDPVKYEEWHLGKLAEKRITYRLVKPEFGNAKTTPHSITISKESNKATFDVGEPIKEEIK